MSHFVKRPIVWAQRSCQRALTTLPRAGEEGDESEHPALPPAAVSSTVRIGNALGPEEMPFTPPLLLRTYSRATFM